MTVFLYSLLIGLVASWLFVANVLQVFAISYLFFIFVQFMTESYLLGYDWKSTIIFVVTYILRFMYFYLFIPFFMSQILAVTMYEAIFLVTFIYIIAKQNNWD